jgi:O-antigen ligase/Flp pilus assembly protein TadD
MCELGIFEAVEMTDSVDLNAKNRHFTVKDLPVYSWAMLQALGIESRLQLAVTLCVITLILVTTLGGSGGAAWTFLTYRTLLAVIGILGIIGTRHKDYGISRVLLACVAITFGLMLISVLRIQGSHFEALYSWSKYALFAGAFLSLANFARYQSARWKALLVLSIVVVNFAHLLPGLVRNSPIVAGFSTNNPNYFATFLLIGLAITVSGAVFLNSLRWRLASAICSAVLLFGIVKTSSRGGTLAAAALIVAAALRGRGRIPRQVWAVAGAGALLMAVIASPFLVRKFGDRGEIDPYNYARTEIWRTSLSVIGQSPLLGVGFGQFYHVSKRFTLPVEGTVARYMKRAQMAHNEYLQHIAELGFPAALLLFGMLGSLVYLAAMRARTAWPEFRYFHEAALLTAIGVGAHALVDNCWTIPVTASSLIVLALADPLPLRNKTADYHWNKPRLVFAAAAAIAIYVAAIVIPAAGLYFNDRGHKAFEKNDFVLAERYHMAALKFIPNHPLFLDNLGMVYFQQFTGNNEPELLPKARHYFQQAIDANRQSLDPHIHMEAALMRSLDANPEHDHNIFNEIISNDTEMLQIDPFLPFTRKNLAGAYYSLGQFDHAMLELRKAIEYEPNYVPGYLQMAAWYGEHGDPAAAERYTATAVQIINRYRDFKPTHPYEGVLLARPEESWAALAEPKR